MILFLALPFASITHALGGVTLTAYTGSNVVLDGVIGSGEWSDARQLSFNWASSNSSLTGGGDVWVKNNGTNLLIAVRANGRANIGVFPDGYVYSLFLLFDDNNNGVINHLDAAKSFDLSFGTGGSTAKAYQAWYYDSTSGAYVTGSGDGTANGSFSNPGGPGTFSWEFSMPMSSSNPQDFNLPTGGTLGFEIIYREVHLNGSTQLSSGWAYWQTSYPNGLPTGTSPSAYGWATIIRQDTPAPISDTTPPVISTPAIRPISPRPSDPVNVTVSVVDTGSGVKNVSIVYTTDNWKSVNKTLAATYSTTTQNATAQIPALQSGGHVEYYIIAFDNAGNRAVNNNANQYFSYDVSSPWYLTSAFYIALAVALAALLAAVLLMAKRKKKSQPQALPNSPSSN